MNTFFRYIFAALFGLIVKVLIVLLVTNLSNGNSDTIIRPFLKTKPRIVLDCKTSNKSRTWYVENIPITKSTDPQRYVLYKKKEKLTLAIRNPKPEKKYECKALKTIITRVQVKLAILPTISTTYFLLNEDKARSKNANAVIEYGNHVEIECVARNAFPSLRLRWFHGDNQPSDPNYRPLIIKNLTSGTRQNLTWRFFADKDYRVKPLRCRANILHLKHKRISEELVMKFRYAPDINIYTVPAVIREKSPFKIYCNISASPQYHSVEWTKDGKSLPLDAGAVLSIPKADMDHTATYTCFADSGYGGKQNASTYVKVLPPEDSSYMMTLRFLGIVLGVTVPILGIVVYLVVYFLMKRRTKWQERAKASLQTLGTANPSAVPAAAGPQEEPKKEQSRTGGSAPDKKPQVGTPGRLKKGPANRDINPPDINAGELETKLNTKLNSMPSSTNIMEVKKSLMPENYPAPEGESEMETSKEEEEDSSTTASSSRSTEYQAKKKKKKSKKSKKKKKKRRH